MGSLVLTWGAVRSELMRPRHEGQLGRQIARRMVDALQRWNRRGRFYRVDPWPQMFAALGLPQPSGKAARAALGLLASLTPLVRRVSDREWLVASGVQDMPEPCPAGHRRSMSDTSASRPCPDRKGKVAGEPNAPQAPHSVAPARPISRVRAVVLERVWGRRPANPLGRLLAAAVERTGFLDRGLVLAVTLTAANGCDVTSAAWALAAHLGGCAGILLVPERSRRGRLHYHGFVVGLDREALAALWRWCASGHAEIRPVRRSDYARLRYWSGYSVKAPADDLEVIAAGVLADWREPLPSGAAGVPEDPAAAQLTSQCGSAGTPSAIDTRDALDETDVSTAGVLGSVGATGAAPTPSGYRAGLHGRQIEGPATPTPAPAPPRRGLCGLASGMPSILRDVAAWVDKRGRGVARMARALRRWLGPGP